LTISVCIPTYGRDAVLCQTVRQALAQDTPAHEILVVDQSPAHEQETERFLSDAQERGAIRWIRLPRPSAALARNTAILEARGDILVFLDDDVEIPRDLLARHLDNYEDPQTIGVVGRFLGEGSRTYEPAPDLPPEALQEPLGWMEVPGNLGRRVEKHLLHSGHCSVRREVAIAAGGFDENFGPLDVLADFDFGWRVGQLKAGRTWHDPEVTLFHLKAARGGCRSSETRWHLKDFHALYPLPYFFLKNGFSLRAWWPRLWTLFRQSVLNKGNVFQPWFMPMAVGRFAAALWRAWRMSNSPPRDLSWLAPEAVRRARGQLPDRLARDPLYSERGSPSHRA
jgi:glycosyltransferase involved in cell wall biosynthesis